MLMDQPSRTAPYAAILGWGHYLPEHVRTNHDLEALIDTSDAWIRERTGIRERHIAAPNESTASMCLRAAERALAKAGVAAGDLDLILCASTTPEFLLPATACLVQRNLGASKAGAFDLNAACCGSLFGLITGSQFIRAGTSRRVLVVAGETLSRFLNPADRGTLVLMGDGAAAFVLEAVERETGLLHPLLACHGDTEGLLSIAGGGSAKPASAQTIAAGDHYLRMSGQEVFRRAVRGMTQAARETLKRAGLTLADVRLVIPHQANLRIIEAVRDSLELPPEKVYVNIDRCGNTGAAALGIALSEAAESGMFQEGDAILLVAFGGGLTWGAALVRWAV